MKDQIQFPQGLVWLIGQCMEAKGKQGLWNHTRPEAMKALREIAIIQSAESSNRIEGVEIESKRLVPLLLGNSKPMDRPEEEVLGYKNALAYVHENWDKIKINKSTILKIHKLCQQGTISDAGKFKAKDNEIIEILSNGERKIRFIPTKASETPKAIEQICLKYQDEIGKSDIPDLYVVANFILDFLCVHPFHDGNGRTSRLLTILLLYKSGYYVGKYISLERIIEEHKENYYDSLYKSSQDWHKGKNKPLHFVMFFSSILRQAYNELSEKVEAMKSNPRHGDKTGLIRKIVLDQIAPFSLKDIEAQLPSVSMQLIKKVFSELKLEKKIKLSGRGKGAVWEVL